MPYSSFVSYFIWQLIRVFVEGVRGRDTNLIHAFTPLVWNPSTFVQYMAGELNQHVSTERIDRYEFVAEVCTFLIIIFCLKDVDKEVSADLHQRTGSWIELRGRSIPFGNPTRKNSYCPKVIGLWSVTFNTLNEMYICCCLSWLLFELPGLFWKVSQLNLTIGQDKHPCFVPVTRAILILWRYCWD